MVKFLLGHARVLEKMVLKVENHKSWAHFEVVDSCKLIEGTQQIQRYYRASKHAEAVFSHLESLHIGLEDACGEER